MKLVRTIAFTVSLVLLGAGYAASQIAYFGGAFAQFTGTFQEYAGRIDCLPVRIVALCLLACCVLFPLIGAPSGAAPP